MNTAVVFGVTGQDGSYLAEWLLERGYLVFGVRRRTSIPNEGRVGHLLGRERFHLWSGDVTDPYAVLANVREAWGLHLEGGGGRFEVYNLAAQSHVRWSFDIASATTGATYMGCLNVLEAIRLTDGARQEARFYQASSSEMFGSACSYWGPTGRANIWKWPKGGKVPEGLFQDENTPFVPNSPYAIAKLAAHHLVRLYRESYGLFACSGILFNHESPRRGEEFVTRKITRYVGRLVRGEEHGPLLLGNMDAVRDWGHARDYMRAAWLMLQQEVPDDYVVATGEGHSVREFLEAAFEEAGVPAGLRRVAIDPALYRPCEVPYLCGRATKAREALGWSPEVDFAGLVREMVAADLRP
jgi:GDPmannose 4,6-dehydratase